MEFLELLKKEPRRFIAQEVIDFQDLDIVEDEKIVPRKADLRALVLVRDEPVVWKSGLTRFSRNPDSLISNLNRAYDNAVVLRESIGSEALSYIQMSVYDMENAAKSEVPLLELQQVLVNIHAFWGIIVSRHKTCH